MSADKPIKTQTFEDVFVREDHRLMYWSVEDWQVEFNVASQMIEITSRSVEDNWQFIIPYACVEPLLEGMRKDRNEWFTDLLARLNRPERSKGFRWWQRSGGG
jgi:hypothetical protein